MEVLLAKLDVDEGDGGLAGTCLDVLLALLADSRANRERFIALGGLDKVSLE